MGVFYGDIVGQTVAIIPAKLSYIIFPIGGRESIEGTCRDYISVKKCAIQSVGMYKDGKIHIRSINPGR